MKKKVLIILTTIFIVCAMSMCFIACSNNNGTSNDDRDTQIVAIYNMYVAQMQKSGESPLSYEDWLASIKGEQGETGPQGPQGVGIEDVYIDDNGNLMIKYTNATEYKNLGKVVGDSAVYDDGNGLEYCMSSDGTGYAVCGIGEYWGTDLIIPSTYKGKPVVEILESSGYHPMFRGCRLLTSVTISDGVTSIGGRAFFDCSSLTSITIPNSVTSIGFSAFGDCFSLTYNVKDGLKYLGNSNNPYLYLADVENMDITTATIDSNCKIIGDSAFYNCSSLTSITIPDSVTNIGSYAFEYCSGLTKVNYLGTIDQWLQIEFGDYYANPLYYAKNLYINNQLVTEVSISASTIGDYAFYNCSSLTSIEITDSVESIGSGAFFGCSGLTSITIPNSVTSIGGSAFCDCSGLTSVTIGDSVTSIGERVFYRCSSLTSIEIPNSVTSIGEIAFSGCSSLTSVTIPDSVESIGAFAFEGCSSLTSATIGDSVIWIGDRAFNGCSSLTSVTIGDSVISIGDYAFNGCSSLTSIKYRGTSSQWDAILKSYYWNLNTGNYTITYNYTGE